MGMGPSSEYWRGNSWWVWLGVWSVSRGNGGGTSLDCCGATGAGRRGRRRDDEPVFGLPFGGVRLGVVIDLLGVGGVAPGCWVGMGEAWELRLSLAALLADRARCLCSIRTLTLSMRRWKPSIVL